MVLEQEDTLLCDLVVCHSVFGEQRTQEVEVVAGGGLHLEVHFLGLVLLDSLLRLGGSLRRDTRGVGSQSDRQLNCARDSTSRGFSGLASSRGRLR